MKWFNNWFNRWKHRVNRLTPTPRQAVLWAVLGLLYFAAGPWLSLVPGLSVLLFIAFFFVCVLDAVQVIRAGEVAVQRHFQGVPQIGLEATLVYEIRRRQPQVAAPAKPYSVRHAGASLLPALRLASGVQASFELVSSVPPVWDTRKQMYTSTETYCPRRRGNVTHARGDVAWHSRFGLWRRLQWIPALPPTLVRPDVTTWRKDVLLLLQSLYDDGRHIARLATGNQEFSYIREYTMDDDPRHINWSATARRGRAMKNVYAPDRGQNVVVAIDASRYMAVELPGGKTRFDAVLETALALVQTAVVTGDKVSVVVFSSGVVWQRTRGRGPSFWQDTVVALAQIEAATVQGGYHALFHYLQTHFQRRSFVILLSEIEGVETDSSFVTSISLTRRRYPLLFVSLDNPELLTIARRTPHNASESAAQRAATWLQERRQNAVRDLQRQGVAVVESAAGAVVVDTVKAYLQKRQRFTL